MQSTHVEVVFNLPRDEGSTPSASTYQAGPVFQPPGFFFTVSHPQHRMIIPMVGLVPPGRTGLQVTGYGGQGGGMSNK